MNELDPNSGLGYRGFAEPNTSASEFSAEEFAIWTIISRISTAKPVQVMSCTNNGGLSKAGTVNVKPLVNQIDGAGNAVPHGVLYQCLYFRMQGGVNAVIMDPQPGDIGVMVFCDRDISSVIANALAGNPPASNPGSRRRYDMADGIYIGGVLNNVPQQYVQFTPTGINMFSPGVINITGSSVNITGANGSVNIIAMNGNLAMQASGSITAQATLSMALSASIITGTATSGDVTLISNQGNVNIDANGTFNISAALIDIPPQSMTAPVSINAADILNVPFAYMFTFP